MINSLGRIVEETQKIILKIYEKRDFSFTLKQDLSPITQADQMAHRFIVEQLRTLSHFPILSEEGILPTYEERKHWKHFWLIDPLDGTKDFISRNGQFTVNIALIELHKPVISVIGVPCTKDIYTAQEKQGTFLNQKKIYYTEKRKHPNMIALESNFHSCDKTQIFCQTNHIQTRIPYGSSLKFCKIITGEGDVYPRFTPTMEWDTAAGQLLAQEAGLNVMDLSTNMPLQYNKPDVKNNNFCVYPNNLQLIYPL